MKIEQSVLDFLPDYRSHKIVKAGEIVNMASKGDGYILTLRVDDVQQDVAIDRDWYNRFHPEIGQFFVVYEDGYSSVSPSAAFRGGYTRLAKEAE